MSRRAQRRKSSGGRFAMLPIKVLAHPAVVTLEHAHFRVLVLLAAQFNGYNNGALGLTKDQAAVNGIGSNNTLYGAFRTLESRGLIERTYHASRVPPRPAMYALSWIPIDATEYSQQTRLPSRAYEEWQPAPGPRANGHAHGIFRGALSAPTEVQ